MSQGRLAENKKLKERHRFSAVASDTPGSPCREIHQRYGSGETDNVSFPATGCVSAVARGRRISAEIMRARVDAIFLSRDTAKTALLVVCKEKKRVRSQRKTLRS